MNTDPSSVLDADAIHRRYAHADPGAVAGFWALVRERGTPLWTADRATFVWQGPSAAEHSAGAESVHLHVNRVTDKENRDRGFMRHVPGTDIWALTLRLPPTLRAGYGFTPLRPGEQLPTGLPRLGHYSTRRDRLNPSRPLAERGDHGLSVLGGDLAPAQPEWEAGQHPPRGHASFDPERGHWLYLPPDAGETSDQDAALPLLTLFDAETWFGDMPLPQALEAAVAAGRFPPVAVLGIANRDREERIDRLGANTKFLRELATVSTAWAAERAAAAGRRLADRARRIIAGQSLGGLSALLAARELPEHYGIALAHSASLWWTLDRRSSPKDLGTRPGGDWITGHLASAAAEPRDVRIRLAVGAREGLTVPHTRTLQQTLREHGYASELTVYDGGHDFAWWRGALLDDLEAVLGAG